MEAVRTPSQSIVIFIFLMATIFDFSNEEGMPQSSYAHAQWFRDSEEVVKESDIIHASYNQPGLQKTKASEADTLYHVVDYQEYKRLRSKFTNFVYPVSIAWPAR